MTNVSSFATVEIAAGAVATINAEGTNFHIVLAPVDVEVALPNGEFGLYQQGAGMDNLPNGQKFKRLNVRNPSLGSILVTVYIGGPLYRDSRAAIIEPKTKPKGWSGTQLAATTGETFDGIPNGLEIRRKCIQVTNLDSNLLLQIRDASEEVVLTVFPRTSITLPISEQVEVYNANGTAVACNISEIWWTV